MNKFSCAVALATLFVMCVPAHSAELSSLDARSQLQLLEAQIAQISLSEKQLQDIVALQEGEEPLTEEEKQHMAQLEALQKRQESGMLKDEDFDFPLELIRQHGHTKCNAQIIRAVLVIIHTAQMQVSIP
jgi:hypothetical protein